MKTPSFHIYYASDNTTTGEINDLGTYYTDDSGRIVLTDVNRGWYKVVEEESPTGFSIQDDGVYEFYSGGRCQPRAGRGQHTSVSALVVYKYDSAGRKLPLEGARFELRYLSGETSGTERHGHWPVCDLVQRLLHRDRASAKAPISCQELESPDGHLIDSEPQTVYISGKEQDVVTLRFGNAPLGSSA